MKKSGKGMEWRRKSPEKIKKSYLIETLSVAFILNRFVIRSCIFYARASSLFKKKKMFCKVVFGENLN